MASSHSVIHWHCCKLCCAPSTDFCLRIQECGYNWCMALNPQVQLCKEGSCPLKRKRLPWAIQVTSGAACAYTSIPVFFGPLLTLLKNSHFYHRSKMQPKRWWRRCSVVHCSLEVLSTCLASFLFPKENFVHQSNSNLLPICEHLNHNITGVTVHGKWPF